ncbi:acyl-CoA N-acyltransferase [Podospora aff. communis PSN243]|uniref:Acyl-CoA N-acyltransferase n=1 Tax=Podospora aff. communis PSN243 TaxID=3040156 RepID=A0AAV9G026_9PEZI|nr:acyl-CoA N-acyltransferase [Podospora aff. communis PSN243]
MEIRTATPSDSQPICKLLLASLTSESQWQYLFPDRHTHGPAHASRIHSAIAHCLNAPQDWTTIVAEETTSKSLVSVAVWSTTTSLEPGTKEAATTLYTDILASFGPADGCNVSHVAAYLKAISAGTESHLAGYTPRVHLYVVATHPQHRGRGYGKALVAWGLKRAAEQKAVVSTLASAKGYVFFSGLGFKDVGLIEVRGGSAVGEAEGLAMKAMVNVAGRERRLSVLRFLGLE